MVAVTSILVVEDEMKIARLVEEYLSEAGFDLTVARDGTSGVSEARRTRPDLIVLDLGLPGMDGFDVTRAIRTNHATPIIMLTARSEETDRVIGLELGADDYIIKPFSPRELVARVKAVLRRSRGALASNIVRAGDVVLDRATRTVTRAGELIDTTATEFDLMDALVSQPGRVFTRGQLLDAIHGFSFESYERAIDSHIKNLRRKLELDPRQPRYIATVYGVGYKFEDA